MGYLNSPNAARNNRGRGIGEKIGANGRHPEAYGNLAAPWRRLLGPWRANPLGPMPCSQPLPQAPATAGPSDDPLRRTAPMAAVEAALFATSAPMTLSRLAKLADLQDAAAARAVVRQLNIAFDVENSPIRIDEIAGGVQMLTRPEYTHWLRRLSPAPPEPQLSPPALEVLAIVAYRQPICRADIEAIRGVQVAEILKQLLDRGLVRLCGRDDTLGRPFLYGTTKRFLETFGLRSLRELPLADLLVRPSSPATSKQPAVK